MKHIKTYEGFSNIYKKGEYVLLRDLPEDVTVPDLSCVVLEYEPKNNENYPYEVEFFNGEQERIGHYEIERYLTLEEIEEFKLKKQALKYNL